MMPDDAFACDWPSTPADYAEIQRLKQELADMRSERDGWRQSLIASLRDELEDAVAGNELHAGLNRRAALALRKPSQGAGSSWHDIPECIEKLRARIKELEEDAKRRLIAYLGPREIQSVLGGAVIMCPTCQTEYLIRQDIADLPRFDPTCGWCSGEQTHCEMCGYAGPHACDAGRAQGTLPG